MLDRPAYLLLLASAADRPRFSDYLAALPPLHARHGGHYLALAPASAIEQFGHNEAPQSLMLSRWPSFSKLLGFWNSAEHRALRRTRDRSSHVLVAAIEGEPLRGRAVADEALAVFLGPGPSPALLEAEGACALALVRENQVAPLYGTWTSGDIAIYAWGSAQAARRQLVNFSSGHRGRSVLVPALGAGRLAARAVPEPNWLQAIA